MFDNNKIKETQICLSPGEFVFPLSSHWVLSTDTVRLFTVNRPSMESLFWRREILFWYHCFIIILCRSAEISWSIQGWLLMNWWNDFCYSEELIGDSLSENNYNYSWLCIRFILFFNLGSLVRIVFNILEEEMTSVISKREEKWLFYYLPVSSWPYPNAVQ